MKQVGRQDTAVNIIFNPYKAYTPAVIRLNSPGIGLLNVYAQVLIAGSCIGAVSTQLRHTVRFLPRLA